MSMRRRGGAILAVVTAVLLVAGCSPFGSGYADLECPREAADKLPDLSDNAYDEIDARSSRFAGEHNGTSVWIARGKQQGRLCLISVPERPEDWISGCGSMRGVKVASPGGVFQALPDDAGAPEGATALSSNVYAFTGSENLYG